MRLSEIDEEDEKKFVIPVLVNGKKVGYHDSGANLTCIRRSILHPLDLKSNEVVKIKNADGRVITIPTVNIKIESQRFGNSGTVEHKVGVLDDLAVADILVGNDLFKSFKQLNDIIQIAAFAHVEETCKLSFI